MVSMKLPCIVAFVAIVSATASPSHVLKFQSGEIDRTTQPDTTQSDCQENSDCPITAPFCHSGACYECEVDTQCHHQYCNDGYCVDCIDSLDCTDDLPICSDKDNTCVECVEDTDCGEEFPVCIASACAICAFNTGYVPGDHTLLENAKKSKRLRIFGSK